jgi:hypothetical protein
MIAGVRVDEKIKKIFQRSSGSWRVGGGGCPLCACVRDNKIFYICKKKTHKKICFFRFFCYVRVRWLQAFVTH